MKLWHKLTILWIAAALIYFFWGVVIILKGGSYETAYLATFPMFIVILLLSSIAGFAILKDKGIFEYEYLNDERAKKISGRAFTYSWLAIFLFVGILVGLDAFDLLDVTISQVLGIIFIFMLLGSAMIHWYYDKKSDVE